VSRRWRFGWVLTRMRQHFANELSLLSELSHDSVVALLGFVENAEDGIFWIVLSWEANGNIKEFVQSQDWVVPERISLIYDVVCGVEYLHSMNPPVCHGDLKSLNVLVSLKNRAIITDFGSARSQVQPGAKQDQNWLSAQPGSCGTLVTLTGPNYTLRWAAPEVLMHQQLGLASDIWAFGWICWEIMTGTIPFDDVQDIAVVLRVAQGDLPFVTSNEQISQVNSLCTLIAACWKMNPIERPTSVECADRI
ncbi:hypothetical protein M407DRAFT_49710, partial [Tulasnella calospora MUT 4182]